jgi:hypothetical protein
VAGWPVPFPRALPRLGVSALAGAAAAAQVLYALGWDNGLVSDDWFFVYGASKIEAPAQLLQFFSFEVEAFVRPTQWLLTTGLYRLFGTGPVGYHVVSQALDLANALLVGLLAWQLFAMLDGADQRPRGLASGLVAVLFLFSWRHHEAVFWFSALNELLACGFELVTLNVLLWWLRGGPDPGPVALAMLGGSVLAMLSKESAAVLPVEALMLVALAHVARRRPPAAWRPDLTLAGVPAVVVLTWAWLFVRTSTLLPGGLARGVSQTLTATPGEWALRFVQFLNANYAGAEALSASETALAFELAALAVLAGLALARRRYLWLFASAWALVAVAPYAAVSHGPDIGLVPVLALGVRGDRFLYTSGAAASLLAVVSGLWLLDEVAAGRTSSRWLPAVRAAAVVAVAGLLALHGSRLWAAEAEWHAAGQIVRQVITQMRQQWPHPGPSETLCLARVPHTYGGKPVYRNGLAESVFLAYGYEGFGVERFENLREPADRARCTATFVYTGPDRGLVKARLVARPGTGGGGA